MLVRCTAPNAINEQPYSGRFAMWQPSQVGDVSNAIAALLVASGSWAPHSAGLAGLQVAGGTTIYGQPITLYQSAVPFIVLGGDGSVAGMRWSAATDGTFTMTAEPLSGLFTGLTGLMALFYLPASAGGASNAAGWYWGKITSATAGIVYGNTYSSGDPGQQTPASPSAFTSVANGWITQVATEITGLSGITLPGGAMGPNGTLEVAWRMHGDTSSTKYFRSKLAGTVWASSQLGANPNSDTILNLRNVGVSNKQISARPSGGPGYNGNTISASEFLSLNTAGDLTLTESLQFSAANGNYAMIRAAARYVVYPG